MTFTVTFSAPQERILKAKRLKFFANDGVTPLYATDEAFINWFFASPMNAAENEDAGFPQPAIARTSLNGVLS